MAQVPGRAGDAGLNAAALPRASGASKSLLEKLTISQLGLPVLDCVEVAFNTTIASGQAFGGQAEVFFATWQEYAGYSTGLIPAGTKVAIKVIRSHAGGGQFKAPEGRLEMHIADRVSRNAQRIELNLLALLHAGGCGARIVQPLAVFNYPGEWVDDPERRARCIWQPMNGYVMKAYPLGSLSILLQDICYRRVPESVGQRFLNLRTMSAEYAAMLRELHNIHTKPGKLQLLHAVRMMIQDLTPGNLLVEDTPDGMRLLLADPAMAQPIKLLQEKGRRSALCGTWLWGSMLVRNRRFDPSADLYSLSISFAEAWLVAEGAVEYAGDLIVLINADLDKARGVQFMRRLVWEVLRLHHQNTINIKPRVQRHLPVSWLGAWLLLLGFRDYACEQHMRQGLPCLRPSEEAVLEAAQLWARIAAAAEELPPSLTEEQALSPACKAIVDDMAQLLQKLVGLSHLSDAGEQEDPALAWCAANFMEQKHPLVAAMKARGATGVGQPDPPRSYKVEAGDWWDAIRAAHHGALLGRPPARSDDQQGEFQEQLQEGERAARTLKELGQWYQGLKHKMAKGAIPVDLYDQLQPPPACRLALELAAEAAATASPAAGEQAPAAVGAAQTAENVASLGEAAGKSGTASPLPHPGTPQLLHVVEGPSGWLEMLAREAAGQPAVAGRKRKSSAVDAPTSAASFDPELLQLLEATYYPMIDTADDEEQRAQPAAAQARFAAPLPTDSLKPTLPPSASPAQLLPVPPAGGATPGPLPPTSARRMMPPDGPEPWSGLQGAGPAAGAAAPLAVGMQRSMPPTSPAGHVPSVPAAAPTLFSFGAALAGAAAPTAGSMLPFTGAVTAGNSFPGGQAAAPVPDSSWTAAAPGALPASGSLGAGAVAGWPGGSLPPWSGQPVGGSSATGLQAHGCSAPAPGLPSPALTQPFWHQPADPAAAVQSVGGLLIPAPSPLGSAPTVAMQPDPFKGGSDKASAKEQRTEAYAKALEELLTLDRVPAPDDVFAPLRTREQVLAFLRWWAVDGPKPSIPGMQFSNKHKSQFVRPVMDKDTPGHGLKAESRDGTWGRRLVLVKDAALTVLRRLEQEQQQQLETNH